MDGPYILRQQIFLLLTLPSQSSRYDNIEGLHGIHKTFKNILSFVNM